MPASTSANRAPAAKTTKPTKPWGGSKTIGKGTAEAPRKRGQATMNAVVAATPKGADKAVDATRIAAALTAMRGKTVRPIPVKRALDKEVAIGRVTKIEDADHPAGSVSPLVVRRGGPGGSELPSCGPFQNSSDCRIVCT